MKSLVKKLVPKPLIAQAHRLLTWAAASRASFPSRKMIVIGVTGTNGKSTTVHLIAHILESAGFKVGYATTVDFKVGETTWLNTHKMTMLGRANLQNLLTRMVGEGVQYAIIETSSEGLAQYRHAGLDYDVAVFTNLTPEHIESHGSFEAYKRAKGRLFEVLTRSVRKSFAWKQNIPKVSIVNGDDPHAPYYRQFPADKHYVFTHSAQPYVTTGTQIIKARDVALAAPVSTFDVDGTEFQTTLAGVHNIENILAALCVGKSQDVPLSQMAQALKTFSGVPGRMEWIDEGQDFKVLIDYAPEAASLAALYATINTAYRPMHGGRVIHVLGSAGGGRDKSRRPVLGKMAGEHADIVIVTNEDPYDEEPMGIIQAVAAGAREAGKADGTNLFTILDRKEAIYKALAMAQSGDLLIFTGKGAEQAIMTAHGGSMPWDERAVVRTLLKTLSQGPK